jgi:hypothetical protein
MSSHGRLAGDERITKNLTAIDVPGAVLILRIASL